MSRNFRFTVLRVLTHTIGPGQKRRMPQASTTERFLIAAGLQNSENQAHHQADFFWSLPAFLPFLEVLVSWAFVSVFLSVVPAVDEGPLSFSLPFL